MSLASPALAVQLLHQGRSTLVMVVNKYREMGVHSEDCVWLVAQLCPTLCNPMDCDLPGSSVRGILQARILEWVVISFTRRCSQPRDWTCISHISRQILFLLNHLGSLDHIIPLLKKSAFHFPQNKPQFYMVFSQALNDLALGCISDLMINSSSFYLLQFSHINFFFP